MLFKPLHRLQKRTLLGISLHTIAQIPTHRKPVLNSTVQINLVRQAQLFQNNLCLMPFLRWEDLICLGGGDGQGSFHVFELGGFDEGGVCGVAGVDFSRVGAQVPDDVFAAETVAYGADFFAIILRPHLNQARINDRINDRWCMRLLVRVVLSSQPLHDLKVTGTIEWDGILVEEVGHHHEVAVCCELVGDQLGVVEAVADNVGDEEDTIFGALIFRVLCVDLEVTKLGELAGGSSLMLDALIAAGSRWVRSHGRLLLR